MTTNRVVIIRISVAAIATGVALATVVPDASAGPAVFPKTITSIAMHASQIDAPADPKPGTSIPARDVRQRVSLGGQVRAGLAEGGTVTGEVFPAVSRDGGSTWTIDGPRFYRAAANAPDVTSRMEARGHHTLIAWGRGGEFVKTTTDLRHWREANFTVGVHSAGVSGSNLVVRALGNTTASGRFATRRYVSRDGGRVWHRGPKLAPVRS